MSKYIAKAEKQVSFEGDTVTIRVDHISMAVAMSLGSADRTVLSEKTEAALRELNVEFIGVKDSSGAAVSTEVVLSKFYFNALVAEATGMMMATGSIGELVGRPFVPSLHSSEQVAATIAVDGRSSAV